MIDVKTSNLIKCSDRCGFGCTKLAFDRATKEADELCEILNEGNEGDLWLPRVWENWGWNYSAVNGCAVVRVNKEGDTVKGDWTVEGYECEIDLGPVGCCHVQFYAKAEKPEDALGFAKQDVRTFFNKSEETLGKI